TTISVPSGKEFLVNPFRSRAFGLPPSTVQAVTLPSVPTTSIWIQECGLTNSHLVTLSASLIGRFSSNSAAKAWCAHIGAASDNRATLAVAIASFMRIEVNLLLLLGGASAAEVIRHAVVAFVAGVLKQ